MRPKRAACSPIQCVGCCVAWLVMWLWWYDDGVCVSLTAFRSKWRIYIEEKKLKIKSINHILCHITAAFITRCISKVVFFPDASRRYLSVQLKTFLFNVIYTHTFNFYISFKWWCLYVSFFWLCAFWFLSKLDIIMYYVLRYTL